MPAAGPLWAQATELQAGGFTVYLPFASKPRPSQQPGGDSGALYFEPDGKTTSADIAVDALGGMHAAMARYAPTAELPPLLYRYCPGPASACTDPASWAVVSLAEKVEDVQIELTPAGQPRLLYQAPVEGGMGYFYAACDTGCGNPASWGTVQVTYKANTEFADVLNLNNPQRFFALDPQGRPRFVYYDRNYSIEPDHRGSFYASCDAACTDAESWTITQMGPDEQAADEQVVYPALTFTKGGQPRVVAHVSVRGGEGGISLLGCDADCTEGASWQRVQLAPRGSGITIGWDLALDGRDRPRLAVYPGTLSEGGGEQLYYLWCDGTTMAECTADTSWGALHLGLPDGSGKQPDLLFDGAGRPRIAWLSASDSLGYSWCNAACETPEGWQHKLVETTAAMAEANPQAVPITCDADLWSGVAPVLALDASGAPRIAYDVTVEARCLYKDPNDPNDPGSTRLVTIWRGVRAIFFPQP